MIHSNAMTRDPEVLGGTWVFAGTRVPVRNLLDFFRQNHDLEEFLADYPTVQRSQADAVLQEWERLLDELAQSA